MILEENLVKDIDLILSSDGKNKNNISSNDFNSFNVNSEDIMFKIKEFSKENLFRENDPYILGWNVAVAGLSTNIAFGAAPVFYGQSLTFSNKWSNEYILNFTRGVSDVLRECNIYSVTGEYRRSNEWRCSIASVGILNKKESKSSGIEIGDNIYISGYIGRGNVEAFLMEQNKNRGIARLARTYKNRFRIRLKESKIINIYGNSCIVTTNGVLNSLDILLKDTDFGYKLNNIPYVKSGMLAVKMLNIPKELLLTGEFGEYELLFTVNEKLDKQFLNLARDSNLNFYKIGKITRSNIKELVEDDRIINLKDKIIKKTYYDKLNDYRNILKSFFKN